MPNTFYPTQLGYIPTGTSSGPSISTLVVGRNITGGLNTFEGAGFGQEGRPDFASFVQINLVQRTIANGNTTLAQLGTINFDINNVLAVMALRSQFPTNLNLVLKEVLVCENSQTKGMLIVGSQTYPTGAA